VCATEKTVNRFTDGKNPYLNWKYYKFPLSTKCLKCRVCVRVHNVLRSIKN